MIRLPDEYKVCNNCVCGIPVYERGKIIAYLCEKDLEDIKDHKMLAENLMNSKACSFWKNADE